MSRFLKAVREMRSTPGARVDLMALAVLLVVSIVCGLHIFGKYDARMPWTDEQLVAAEFDKLPSVRPESRQEVRVAGVTVGKIVEAEPLANGNARLVMSVDPDLKIFKDARVVLQSKAPINVMYVALNPGTPSAGELGKDQMIPMEQTDRLVQPWELLNHLDERTQAALTSLINNADAALASAPKTLAPGLRATTDVMSTFAPVVAELRERRVSIRALVTALSQVATAVGEDDARLATLVASLRTTLVALDDRSQDLDTSLARLPGFLDNLDGGMESADALADELTPTLRALGAASDDLPAALARLRKTARSADELVGALDPALDQATPVLADLRPVVPRLNRSLGDINDVTEHLPEATKRLAPWMHDLAAFVYQTSSAFSLSDVNGGLGRADLRIDLRNPTGGLGGDPSHAGDLGGGN